MGLSYSSITDPCFLYDITNEVTDDVPRNIIELSFRGNGVITDITIAYPCNRTREEWIDFRYGKSNHLTFYHGSGSETSIMRIDGGFHIQVTTALFDTASVALDATQVDNVEGFLDEVIKDPSMNAEWESGEVL